MMSLLSRLLITLLIVLVAGPSFAIDKYLGGSTNNVIVRLFSTASSGAPTAWTGRTYSTDYVIKVRCDGAETTVASPTVTEIGNGYYRLSFSTSIANNPEQECIGWPEGAGNYARIIASTASKFKAVSNVLSFTGNNANAQVKDIDATAGSAYCDIGPTATDADTFQVNNCIDSDGNAMTEATGQFNLWGFRAYTNGGAPCNVVDEVVQVLTTTLNAGNLDVQLALDASNRGGFSATPNTSNCGVVILSK